MPTRTARIAKPAKKTRQPPRRRPESCPPPAPDAHDLAHIEASLCAWAVPIDNVSEDPANVREHPEQNLEAIKASLRRFGPASAPSSWTRTASSWPGTGR